MNSIKEIQEIWKDEEATHKLIAETLTSLAHSITPIKEHREFVEQKSWGFGETCFCAMHKLLVDEMPEKFTFMEIGVYKGAILSLYRMLADMAGKKATRYGVSPMSTAGDFQESDFEQDVRDIHHHFNLEKDYTIIKGLSTDPEIIEQAKQVGPLDILYVDGGHSKVCAQSDIINYGPLLKVGAFLVIDDCANRFKLPSGYFFGIESVTEAVEEILPPFTANGNYEFLFNVGHNLVWRRTK